MECINSIKNRISLLIFSCDKYQDLWESHFFFLNKYWNERSIKTILVTDCNTSRKIDNVEIVSAGENSQFSDRMPVAVKCVNSKYIMITLDDYMLTEKVEEKKIENILDIMDEENLDYVRLYRYPRKKIGSKLKGYRGIYRIDATKTYQVNLFVGIWRKDFLEKTFVEGKNAWQYEVSLASAAKKENAKCAMTNGNEFKIIDVVCKGKFFHKGYKFLKKYNLYTSDRKILSRWYEIKLEIKKLGIRSMPKFVTDIVRTFMIKLGHTYYSQQK